MEHIKNTLNTTPSHPEKDGITDAIYRAIIGLDTNDYGFFNSAWARTHPCVFDFNGRSIDGRDAIDEQIFHPIGPLDTMHFLSNVRVQSRAETEEGTAYLTCYALAQHFRPGEGVDTAQTAHLLGGAMYFVNLVKEEGEWRVSKWAMKIVWLEGDMGVLQSGGAQE